MMNFYGSVKYEDKKLRERFSDMHKLADDYLSWIDYKKNPIEFKRHSLKQFTLRGLEIDFNKKFKEIQSILDKMNRKDEDYFYFLHNQLNDKRTFYEGKFLSGKRRPSYEDLKTEIDQFTLFFLSKMLGYYIVMQNREMALKFDFEFKMYKPIMKFMSENNFDSYPIIKLYYLAIRLVKDSENEEIYYELKKYLMTHTEFDIDDKKLIHTDLFNYAMGRAYKGRPGFEEEAVDIMNLQLKDETYPTERSGGWMDYSLYINYVMLSIGMDSLELTEKFINDYTRKLNPEKKENLRAFADGQLHYAQKKYGSALVYLSKIKGVDFSLYVKIKTLLSKIYFDQEEYGGIRKCFNTH